MNSFYNKLYYIMKTFYNNVRANLIIKKKMMLLWHYIEYKNMQNPYRDL